MLYEVITDHELLPATLSKYLLNGLLREHLGFNGLIITDASGMCGFNSFATREETVVNAINARITSYNVCYTKLLRYFMNSHHYWSKNSIHK